MVQELSMEIYPSLGMNTAVNAAQVPQGAQRLAYDAVMRGIGTIGKRDGSAPVTADPLTEDISYLTTYRTPVSDELLVVSNDKLYRLNSDVLTQIPMTDLFASPNVLSVAFTDATNVSVLFMVDGGNMKQYDAVVKNIVPGANDTDPAPPNDLTNINSKGVKYCWVHTGHVFVSDGSDTLWYSKRFMYNYFPSVQFERFVRNNDYITGAGITFNNVCLIPMRRGFGILTGELFDDGTIANGFSGNQFLNTTAGNISSRGNTRLTYPDGSETVAYLSDDGVHEIFIVSTMSSGDRQYATRSLTNDKLDFASYGFTEDEKKAGVMWFDNEKSRMLIAIDRGTTHYIFCYDTRNREFYVWRLPWTVKTFTKFGGINYFGGTLKHVQAFSEDLYSDWDDKAMTVGTPVDFDVYSGLLSFEFTGDSSYLHYYLLEAQQWMVRSALDVAIIYGTSSRFDAEALINTVFIWGVEPGWDKAEWSNLDFTDIINNARRLVYHKKAKYFQRRWRNNRDEPVLILREKFIGSISGRE